MSKMKKNRKKLFAILLQAALVSTAMTMPAYAAKTPGIGSDALIGDDATGPVLTGGNTEVEEKLPVHQRTARGWDAGIWRDSMANRGVQQHVLKPAFPALQQDDQPVGGNCPGGRGERPHGRCDGPEVRRYGCGDERAV